MTVKRYRLKTHSSCKKRFKITGTGKIVMAHVGKRHGMRKQSNNFIRSTRGMKVVSDGLTKVIVRVIPNGIGGRRLRRARIKINSVGATNE
jgi:large subunit ribosomal protein L35